MTRFRMTNAEKDLLAERCIEIVSEYAARGFRMTVRQIHYQLISRFPGDYTIAEGDTDNAYGRCQRMVAELRESGDIEWDRIEDRTRALDCFPHWQTPKGMLQSCAEQYRIDLWDNQEYRPEIWTEKQAVIGIVMDLQDEYDLTLYTCRGFNSLSGAHETQERFKQYLTEGKTPILLYLGDCDPSGQIMDAGEKGIQAKLPEGALFERLALTAGQAQTLKLPPLPAKRKDTRTVGYIERNGHADCWELDALGPDEIQKIITDRLSSLIDRDLWDESVKRQQLGRDEIAKIVQGL